MSVSAPATSKAFVNDARIPAEVRHCPAAAAGQFAELATMLLESNLLLQCCMNHCDALGQILVRVPRSGLSRPQKWGWRRR
jgi:hypothetical protein